ncbi:HNH endonuclease [Actinomadura kijaniata]|uniref:5-methylcytosine-specific restriction endonuclease McrA n=1 Tax=Actinomadura namibiensis TaxID=182080 RepID=A0A7W3LQG1_ACTNM|nr:MULTISPECIES: HNH endonuclease [Actinomadura]MBA8952413.1 5-methylcytosine-specific restriction endonuclease McrA [Actinomadura namibiensis]
MHVLVLNASYEPLQRVDLRHAIRMLVREVAVVEEAEEGRTIGRYPMPRVLRLVRYVAMRWRHGKRPPWSKRGVHLRDRGRCQYCGGRGHTIDHVVPQSRGGPDTWENTVLACGKCNNRKGNRTPAEAGLNLREPPRVPRWEELMNLS